VNTASRMDGARAGCSRVSNRAALASWHELARRPSGLVHTGLGSYASTSTTRSIPHVRQTSR
jgi:hypothetical protein